MILLNNTRSYREQQGLFCVDFHFGFRRWCRLVNQHCNKTGIVIIDAIHIK